MAETIKSKVEDMMASETVQERIQRRLKEERAALEDKVLLMLNIVVTVCHDSSAWCWGLPSSVHHLKHSLEPSCFLHLISHAYVKTTWT